MKRKRILITGSHGFFGSHLVEHLKAKGYHRLLLPTHREYDLTQKTKIRSLFQKTKPQIVIHCAAKVGGIGANQKNPGLFFYSNLIMGVELMEESRLQEVEKFVSLGTVCSYPKFTPVPFQEKNIWNGYPEETNAPYGLAKKMLLVQAQAYRAQYGLNAIYLIPVNMYGPRDNFNLESSHVIPALIRKFFEAKREKKSKVMIWGDGSASREFLYVEDCAEAIRLAMERYEGSQPVNIGTGQEITIRSLAQLISRKVGYQGKIVWDKSRPNGQPRRCLDTSQAKKLFGFKAKISFEKGLAKTIDWYSRNLPGCGR